MDMNDPPRDHRRSVDHEWITFTQISGHRFRIFGINDFRTASHTALKSRRKKDRIRFGYKIEIRFLLLHLDDFNLLTSELLIGKTGACDTDPKERIHSS